jgi:WXG100 protein secretion system (Wss), protein YukD/Protein of Unknown function (DUF2604)
VLRHQKVVPRICAAGTVHYTDRMLECTDRREYYKVSDPQGDVHIIVSGQTVDVSMNPHQTVEHLVHEALNLSGNKGQMPSDWSLKTQSGSPIGQDQTIAQAGIHNGDTLYLNPVTGTGG